jgi:type IV fimbrial biogenesis protein FimT
MRGMSLVELMIGIVLLGILVMLGLPSFTTYIQNAQVRTQAEVIQAGTATARSEALNRNVRVEFVLTNDEPLPANVGTAGSTSGKNWIVRVFQTSGTYSASDFIQGASGSSAANAVVSADTASFTYDGIGRTNLAGANTIQITNPTAGTCVASGGEVRCLNVVIQTGGQQRMCDPSVTTAGDTRAC